MPASPLRTMLLFAWITCSGALAADERPLPRVPNGFTVEVAAAPPLVTYPMLAGFDERGRLFVAESAGQNLKRAELEQAPPNFIRRLEDVDGDGVFDKSTIFADKMTFPMGALWYRGALYVASPPNIWRLRDADDDGVADEREILVDTFGYTGNAADIHGCFLSPGGRIFWCDGRHGHEFRDAEGNITSQGKAARIFSCRPDGSDVRVFCGGGMDNPVEVDFTETGEVLGSVNILLSDPRVDCLMHWVEGGAYPRFDQTCVDEFQKTGELLPPMTKLGHVAVSGVARYRSEVFGPEYRDNLFTAIFNTHRVLRSVVERDGATFRTREDDFFVSDDPDCHPTDVLEDADGSLLVIDTGGWFRIGCPTSQVAKPELQGAIYRIRKRDAQPPADPRGLELALERKPPAQLVAFFDDPRPSVRERAVDLAAQADPEAAAAALQSVLDAREEHRSTVTARRNAIWALARLKLAKAEAGELPASVPDLAAALLGDKDESVRIAAADVGSGPRLLHAVVHDTPAVRRTAAATLGRDYAARPQPFESALPVQSVLAALFESLRTASTDRVLEHALIYAVICIADCEQTIPYLSDSSPHIRRAALIALDQMHGGELTRELVTPLLDTDDSILQQTALEVIGRRPGWASATVTLVQEWLAAEQLDATRTASLRGLLLAQSEDPAIRRLIAVGLQGGSLPVERRALLLEVVERSRQQQLPDEWRDPLGDALDSRDELVLTSAVRAAGRFAAADYDSQFEQIARRPDATAAVRVAALEAVSPRLKALDAELFHLLLAQLADDVNPLDRLAAARALRAAPLSDEQIRMLAEKLPRAGPLVAPVLLQAFSRSTDDAVGRSLVAALDSAASGVPLEELRQVLDRFSQDVQQQAQPVLDRLAAEFGQRAQRIDELLPLAAAGDAALGREVFHGRKAACASCHAVAGVGGRVGPDLTTIGQIRTGRDLLEAVLFPSASFARGYRSYAIVTEQGRVYNGLITRETGDAVYLRNAELEEIRIPRSSIEAMKESEASIMPKGLEATLSESELRDLLAYLQSLK